MAAKFAVGDRVSRMVDFGEEEMRYGLNEMDAATLCTLHAIPESCLMLAPVSPRRPSPGPAPQEQHAPQWQLSRSLSMAMGECVCGIARRQCDYHR